MTRRHTPRTAVEALHTIDDILGDVIPRYTVAQSNLLDMQPGHSGRPAGTGEPGGGSGGTSSVTERVALGHHPERYQLDQLERLPLLIEQHTADLADAAGLAVPPAAPYSLLSARLAWARWVVRLAVQDNARTPHRAVQRLWHDVVALDDHVRLWSGEARPAHRDVKGLGITTSSVQDWCPNHLRAQLHEPSYRAGRYCRWCVDFRTAQGYLPEPGVLEARHLGRKITEALIAQHKPSKRRKAA